MQLLNNLIALGLLTFVGAVPYKRSNGTELSLNLGYSASLLGGLASTYASTSSNDETTTVKTYVTISLPLTSKVTSTYSSGGQEQTTTSTIVIHTTSTLPSSLEGTAGGAAPTVGSGTAGSPSPTIGSGTAGGPSPTELSKSQISTPKNGTYSVPDVPVSSAGTEKRSNLFYI